MYTYGHQEHFSYTLLFRAEFRVSEKSLSRLPGLLHLSPIELSVLNSSAYSVRSLHSLGLEEVSEVHKELAAKIWQPPSS